jgi:hypothetical protein
MQFARVCEDHVIFCSIQLIIEFNAFSRNAQEPMSIRSFLAVLSINVRREKGSGTSKPETYNLANSKAVICASAARILITDSLSAQEDAPYVRATH